MRKFLVGFMILLIVLTPYLPVVEAMQAGEEFISFGADLNQDERDQLLRRFQPEKMAQMLEVTNAEEHRYLDKYVPTNQIGSKAISSVYIKTLEPKTGVNVLTFNITWVSSGMYANAAVTAGVKDVLIKAAAPFPVSGTAALTGIFKTFEMASGKRMDPERKDVAYQELITSGQLGEEIGQKETEVLIREVKKEVINQNANTPDEIQVIIDKQAKKYELQLTPEQMTQVQKLMEQLQRIDLNVDEINQQLKYLNTQIQGIKEEGKEIKGFLARILNLLEQLFHFISSLFS